MLPLFSLALSLLCHSRAGTGTEVSSLSHLSASMKRRGWKLGAGTSGSKELFSEPAGTWYLPYLSTEVPSLHHDSAALGNRCESNLLSSLKLSLDLFPTLCLRVGRVPYLACRPVRAGGWRAGTKCDQEKLNFGLWR